MTKKATHQTRKYGDDEDTFVQHESVVTHIRARFSGLDAPGACSVPEVKEGDVLLWIVASDGEIGNHGFFEPIVTVDCEIQQKKPLAGHSFDAIFLRGVE